MEVWGDTLSGGSEQPGLSRARPRPLEAIISKAPGDPTSRSTNQWLDVVADEIVKETNLVTFRGKVEARMLDGEQLQDTLTSALLLVTLDASNQIQSAVARGVAAPETAVDPQWRSSEPHHLRRPRRLRFPPGGGRHYKPSSPVRKVIDARQMGRIPEAPVNHWRPARVTAGFSSVTSPDGERARGRLGDVSAKPRTDTTPGSHSGIAVCAPPPRTEQVELTSPTRPERIFKYAVIPGASNTRRGWRKPAN